VSSPFGRMAARVSPTARRRILLGTLVASIVVYELDAVADGDSVTGDSISATTRDLFRVHDSEIGRTLFTLCWGWLGAWYAAHALKDVVDGATN
jgi:hypothetical protein